MHGPNPNDTIQDLLGDIRVSRFLSEFYTHKALFLPGRFEPNDLLTLDDLEDLLSAREAFATTDVMAREPGASTTDRIQSLPHLLSRVEKGHSIHLAQIDRLMPDTHPVIRMMNSFAQATQAPVRGITAFIAPPGKSIPIHHDVYEAVTIQLAGFKRWKLYHFASPEVAPPAHFQVEAPKEVVTLAPGDALYVPKGQIHKVEGVDGMSFSLALVYQPPSWLTLAEHLIQDLTQDPVFWKTIAGSVADGVNVRKQALIEAVHRIDGVAFAERMEPNLRSQKHQRSDWHLRDSAKIATISVDTEFHLRPGKPPRVKENGSELCLMTQDALNIRLDKSAASAVQFILSCNRTFNTGEICGDLNDANKLALVRILASRGVIVPAFNG